MSNILIISPEPWGGHFVSKHHYAMELSKRGHGVFFHGPPEKGPAILVPERCRDVEVTVLRAPRIFPGIQFFPGKIRGVLESLWLRRFEVMIGKRIDLVWLFENSRFFNMRFAGDRVKIYHQVDLNQDFHPEAAAATSDLTIAVSAPIEKRLKYFAKKIVRITHGCSFFISDTPKLRELELRFSDGFVNVVLTGNLNLHYLDVPLVKELVDAHPNVRFHFIGNYKVGQGLHAAVGCALNAIFWGWQPSENLPNILRRADVLLVTYLSNEHLDQLANPHKIMEYLASGRCILATRTLEYEEHPGLVEVAKNRVEFRRRFAEIVASPSSFNSPDLIMKRQAFAADNTYSRQLDRIAEALGPNGYLISRQRIVACEEQ